MKRILLGGLAAIAMSVSFAAGASAADVAWCNPVTTTDGVPLRTVDGGYVVHQDSVRCPAAVEKVEVKTSTATFVILFELDSARLTVSGQNAINAAAAATKVQGAKSVAVVGHADRSGTDRYNMGLSAKRAEAVRKALVAAGVPAQMISAEFKGERAPYVATPDGKTEPLNRRAEVTVTIVSPAVSPAK